MQTSNFRPGLSNVAVAVARRMHIVRYAGFAAGATLLNLMCQNSVLLMFGGYWFGIYAAMLFGNASGLFFKFVADKYWVFEDRDASLAANSRQFALYAGFGVFTTLIFWAVELSFHLIFQSALMTNIGAIVGLSIGYVIKYNLDKWITFGDGVDFRIATQSMTDLSLPEPTHR